MRAGENISVMAKLLRPEVEEMIGSKDWKDLKEVLSKWHPSDVSDLLKEIDIKDSAIILRILPKDMQGDIFSELPHDLQEKILKNMADKEISQIITEMDPDDRTKLFEELNSRLTQRLLNLLTPEDRKEALQLLGYSEDSVGRLMSPDYVALKPDWTIQKAMEHIRKYGKDTETIDMVYVVDNEWHLLDDIPIRRLLLADVNDTVESIMDHKFISVNADVDQEEVIKLFEKYNLFCIPVTDEEGHLLGIVTADDVLETLREEETEDFAKFSGVEVEKGGADFITRLKDVPLRKIFRTRITWLLALLIMDLITGGIIQGFEATIAKYVVLVTFLPVLVDTAGNAGSQSATLVIRALALGTVKMKDWLYLLWREFLVAAALGIVMGAGISIMGFVRGRSFRIAEVVILAMFINVVIGSLIGVLLPFIFTRFKKDPATASTPLITTLSDIIGTAIYLGLASLMLS